MRRYGMTISPLLLSIACISGEGPTYLGITVAAINACWFFIEVFIARTQQYENQVPRSPLVTLSRVFWLLTVVFMAVDLRLGIAAVNYHSAVSMPAIPLLCAGLLIRLIAFMQLGKYFSYDVRLRDDHRLVKKGLYRWIRHPAYLAVCILGSFTPLAMGSVLSFIMLFLFTVPQTLYRLNIEEKMLEERFGDEFRAYAGKSWKLLPPVY